MGHNPFLRKKRSILQLLCLRQTGLGNARTLSRLIARGLYTGGGPLVCVLNTKVTSSGFDHSSEELCFIKYEGNVPYLCITKINTDEFHHMGPHIPFSLEDFNCYEKLVGVSLIESSYPFFTEKILPCDLEPSVLILKQTCLLRLHAGSGRLLSTHNLLYTGSRMSTWDISEDDDWLIIQSTKQVRNYPAPQVVFVVFQLHPFAFYCCFSVTHNSFCNPSSSLYGNISPNTSFNLHSTYISVSTTKGYTFLFNFRSYVDGLVHGKEVIQEASNLPCVLVLPGYFSLMSIEAHCGDFTMLFGNEPHSMHLTSIKKLINFAKFLGCGGQISDLLTDLVFSPDEKLRLSSNSYKRQRELMLKFCGRALQWEEEDCNFICSCSVDLFPGEFNRLVVKEPGSLRIYQLPDGNLCDEETSLFDNVLLKCGMQRNDSEPDLDDYTKSGRRIQRPPKYRRYHVPSNYFCSYSHELNLVTVVCVQRLGKMFLLTDVSFYDSYNFSLVRNLGLNLKVDLNGQDPTSVDVYLVQGIIMINFTIERFHRLLAFKLGFQSDSNPQPDLHGMFDYLDSEDSDSS